MNATIKIEISAGTAIVDAFESAIRISQILNCIVEFKFNGITCFTMPHGDSRTGQDNYNKALKNKSSFVRCY